MELEFCSNGTRVLRFFFFWFMSDFTQENWVWMDWNSSSKNSPTYYNVLSTCYVPNFFILKSYHLANLVWDFYIIKESFILFYYSFVQNPVWPAWAQVRHLLSATDWLCCWQKSQRAPSSRTCLLLFFTFFFPCDESISITDICDPWLKYILDVFCEE